MNTTTLDTFTRAYIECALWSSTGPAFGTCHCCGAEAVLLDRLPEPEFEQQPMCGAPGCGVREDNNPPPLDKNYGVEDISPETLAQMAADCAAFQHANAELLASVGDPRRHGHDFWLTREGHGAGFWGRGYGETGHTLTDASKAWGEFNLYPGDDAGPGATT